METQKKVEEWAKRMGYKGKIPPCFQNICGPSTAHIWEQLVTKVKPKDEISHVRNNVIVNKLKEVEEKGGSSNDIPTREAQAYDKREKLRAEIARLRDDVSERTEELEGLDRKLRARSVRYETVKEGIRETKRKELLYRKKSRRLERDISAVREKLDFAISVTPTEGQRNHREITETLKRCAEKIEVSVERENANATVVRSSAAELFDGAQPELSEKIDCLNDAGFSEDIKDVLCRSNIKAACNAFEGVMQESKMKLSDAITSTGFDKPHDRDNSEAINSLYAADIENSLLSIKYKKKISTFRNKLDNKKREIFARLEMVNLSPEQLDSVRNTFLLQLEEAGLSASIDELQKILTALTEDDETTRELATVQSKSFELERKIENSFGAIRSMAALYKETHRGICSRQLETKGLLEKLHIYTDDLDWLAPLTENLNTQEIQVFDKFDLRYNRVVILNGNRVPVRDVLRDCASALCTDQNTLKSVQILLGGADGSPENAFVRLLQTELRSDAFDAQDSMLKLAKYEKHSVEDLKEREACVNRGVVRLEDMLKRNAISIPKRVALQTEKSMGFWLEMPIKEYVSSDRLVDGKNLGYYQKIYDVNYNKL